MRSIYFVFLFLFFSLSAFAQISLISYGLDEEGIYVKWKYYLMENVDSNVSFSVYRSKVLVSNVVSFSNSLIYVEKLGTFLSSDLKKEKGYFYFLDKNPNVGTNYYFVLLNKGGNEVVEFYPEQNFSSSFVYYMPLPIVKVDFSSELNSIILTWDRVDGVTGYFVYKVPINFTGDLTSFSPLVSLPKGETLFIDVKPSDKGFKYIVVPFVEGLTNFYYFSKKNSVVIEVKTNLVYSYSENTKGYESFSGDLISLKDSDNVGYVFTNYVTNFITNIVTNNVTNVIFVSNFVNVSKGSESNIKVLEDSVDDVFKKQDFVSGHNDVMTFGNGDFNTEFKKAVKEFNKGNYATAKRMFYSILEFAEDDEVRVMVMVYIARCEYATGNKDIAIKMLLKAKKLGSDDADFWLTRFLVNK